MSTNVHKMKSSMLSVDESEKNQHDIKEYFLTTFIGRDWFILSGRIRAVCLALCSEINLESFGES